MYAEVVRLNPTQGASQIVRVGRLWAWAKQLENEILSNTDNNFRKTLAYESGGGTVDLR